MAYGRTATTPARRDPDAVGTVLGPLGEDPDRRPVGAATRVARTPADGVAVDPVEAEHDLDVGELGEPVGRPGLELGGVELDGAGHRVPLVVDGLLAATGHPADGPHDDRRVVRRHGPL